MLKSKIPVARRGEGFRKAKLYPEKQNKDKAILRKEICIFNQASLCLGLQRKNCCSMDVLNLELLDPSPDLHGEGNEGKWNLLSRAKNVVDGRSSDPDILIYSLCPLVEQRPVDALPNTSIVSGPCDWVDKNIMFLVCRKPRGKVRSANFLEVDNSTALWTLSPNSWDSGKTIIVTNSDGSGEEKFLHVMQSRLIPKKSTKTKSSAVMWIYNRVFKVADGKFVGERDISLYVVNRKSRDTASLQVIESPRKRCLAQFQKISNYVFNDFFFAPGPKRW